jgi:hypothetical protein
MAKAMECSECVAGCWDPKKVTPFPAPCTVTGTTPTLRGYRTVAEQEEISILVKRFDDPNLSESMKDSTIRRLDNLGWSPF